MDKIPFFPEFVTYAPMIFAIIIFLFSYSKKQYESWGKIFDDKNAKKILIFMRYIAPPIMILSGVAQLMLR